MRFPIARSALLLLLPALPAFGQDCDPKPSASTLSNLVDARNASGLSQHLLTTAGLSDDFKDAHGEDRVKGAIDDLVSKYFDSRSQEDPSLNDNSGEATQVADKFRHGILAACEAATEGSSDNVVAKKAIQAANLSGGDSNFVVLLGTVNSLEGDGAFSSGLEASFQSTTNFEARHLPIVNWLSRKNPNRAVTGTFEITFSEIGSIDDEAEDEGMMMMGMQEEMNRNPFAAGGGFFRLNTSLDFYRHPSEARGLGVRVGAGLSTLPRDNSNDDVDTRGRGYGGIVFRANYGQDDSGRSGKGEVFIGYAKDKFWNFERITDASMMPPATERVKETDRIVIDARMDVPKVFESDDVRLHARLFADTPASGDGPSDIRVSLLLTVNLGAFFPVD